MITLRVIIILGITTGQIVQLGNIHYMHVVYTTEVLANWLLLFLSNTISLLYCSLIRTYREERFYVTDSHFWYMC